MGLTINQLFNVNDYLTQYPDVVEAIRVGFVADALDHFTRFGAAEGRSPSRFFDSQLYLTLYSDVQTAINQGSASNALDHYLRIGQTQNRQPIAFFDSNYYLQKYPDVAEAIRTGFVTSAYEHFFIYGQTENRAPSALFNANFYLAQYPDVQAAIADGFVRNPFEHFAKYGQREGRTPSELFSPSFYLTQYPDVAEAIRTGFVGSVYHHFVLYGQKENRNPSENFNSSFYLSQYPDVAAAIQTGFVISAFDHYARFGQTEGRLPVSPTGIIRGLQWNDINGDSLLNAGEPGLAGWTIFLDQNQNGQKDAGELATITDTNGNYTFDGLAAGVYTVVAVPQDGWTETYPGASTTQTINLQAGQTIEDVNFAVNALPIIEANTGLTVDEGGSFTIGVNELRVTDADNSATQLVYTLTDLPDHGILQLDGIDLAVNQTFTQADIDSDRFSYVHNGKERTRDSFAFTVADTVGNTVNSDFQISVDPVNDAPFTINNAGRLVRPGQTVTISNSFLFIGDEESFSIELVYTVNQLPTQGILKLNDIPLSIGQTFTQFDINNNRLSYQNTSGEIGSDRFDFSVTDGENTIDSSFALDIGIRGVPGIVKDINPGASNSSPRELTNVDDLLYFIAENENGHGLWRSDGTAVGTNLIQSFSDISASSGRNFTNVQGTLYFVATSYSGSYEELWKSDGTTAGTMFLKEFYPVPGSPNSYLTYLNHFTDVNGTVYFRGTDASTGTELWKSDGTTAGTTSVKDINPGTNGSQPDFLTTINDTLYLKAFTPDQGDELWKSDGTAAGTTLVKDINPGTDGSSLANFVNVNSQLYFTAYTPTTGTELWKSDGTAAGTTLVKDINSGTNSSTPNNLTNVDGTLYFTVTNTENGTELWKSNGTAAGTTLVKDINLGTSGSSASNLTNVNGTLYFTAKDDINGLELWKSDGTAAGTMLVKKVHGNSSASSSEFINVDGLLYFTNLINGGIELWRSDGTTTGTKTVQPIYVGGTGIAFATSLANVNGTLYFGSNDATYGTELWAL